MVIRRAVMVAALACLASPAAADWGNSRGGPERDGVRVGVADLRGAQIVWRQPLGGRLSAGALWTLPDPVIPRIAAVFGGRMSLKRWDDAESWRGDLHGIDTIQTSLDIDGDGAIDLLIATGLQNGDVLIGYTADGIAAFTPPPGLLGPVTSGVRVIDLDGDGLRELYVTPLRAGSSGKLSVAFRFPAGAGSGEVMYTIDAGHRDYFGGFFDAIGELDGTPGLEIAALGRNHIYLYDAATGALESTSDDLGPIPFARATLRVVDVDGDGVSELFGFSDESWSAANNRRYVALFAHDGEKMAVTWRRDVSDVVNDRVAFSDSSVTDLDGDGQLEVAFAIYTAANGAWVTEVVDAATGASLESIDGERFADVSRDLAGGPALFTGGDGEPLRAYRFARGAGLALLGDAGELELISCRDQLAELREAPTNHPCQATSGVVLAAEKVSGGDTAAIVALDAAAGLGQIARFDGQGGAITGVVEIGPSHPAVIAAVHTDGLVIPLDENLRTLPPSPKPPFSWTGIRFGTRFSGTDLATFPLVIPAPAGEPEEILAIANSGRAVAIDASRAPTMTGGAEIAWSRVGADRAVVSASGVTLFDNSDGVTGLSRSGEELWRIDDLFGSGRGLHNDPLLVRRDGVDQIWFHRRHSAEGRYDLTAVDAATGQVVIDQPNLDINDNGWRRLSLAIDAGVPVPQSGPLDQVWRFGPGGEVISAQDTRGVISLSVPTAPMLLQISASEIVGFDRAADQAVWTFPYNNSLRLRLGAMLNVGGVSRYATGQNGSPVLTVLEAETGLIAARFALIGGELVDPDAVFPAPAPVLSNVSAITDLTGDSEPAYLVGASDGFIYAIDAIDHRLRWSVDAGAAVGEIVPADWDGDGRMELVASTADGALVGIDTFTGAAPEWVYDTDGVIETDVDELATERTLFAAWAAVEGATDYEVAVFGAGGAMVSEFRRVGAVTSATLGELPLESGLRYAIAVRAISELGTSSDTASDGVTVLGDNDGGGGCCQVSAGWSGGLQALVLALLCALVARRRRR
jgi:hypothetical protein